MPSPATFEGSPAVGLARRLLAGDPDESLAEVEREVHRRMLELEPLVQAREVLRERVAGRIGPRLLEAARCPGQRLTLRPCANRVRIAAYLLRNGPTPVATVLADLGILGRRSYGSLKHRWFARRGPEIALTDDAVRDLREASGG
jgi:hypothetical protein